MASTASPNWCALLPELLVSILALLPMRPRLRVTSLVCRRWHAASLQSITTQELSVTNSAPLLPSVTSLTINPDNLMRLPPLPHTITELLLYCHPSAHDGCLERLTKLTGLTRLYSFAPTITASLLLANASLTDLELNITTSVKTALIESFAGIRAPHLQRLSLSVSHGNLLAPLLAFVAAHASQLSALVLSEASDVVALPPLPQLTHLTTLCDVHLITDTVAQTLMPRLAALAILLETSLLADMPSFPYTALTDLTLILEPESNFADEELFRKCWRIRVLTVQSFPSESALAMLPNLEQLTVDVLSSDVRGAASLAVASRLTDLAVVMRKGSDSNLVLPPMPQLRSLDLFHRSVLQLNQVLLPVLTVATHLHTLTIRGIQQPLEHIRELVGLTKAAEAAGVCKIEVRCSGNKEWKRFVHQGTIWCDLIL